MDFLADLRARDIEFTGSGKNRVSELIGDRSGVWTSVRARNELILRALSALHFFERDRQYVVREGKVQIVDEFTGRVMPDRSWERGLQQIIEVKEGCAPTSNRETLARITYQRFFRRYLRLSGMTGTAKEVAAEVSSVYRLPSVTIPLHRPSRRRYFRGRMFRTAAEKWSAIVDSIEQVAVREGRPVLVGTRSVDASEHLSRMLARRGIHHSLLNARQDETEAEIISAAGQQAKVTVATNMAGRGTDIRLDAESEARGGLHVILSECHTTSRVDRQLIGRCARQGNPGSCQMLVSLDDEVFRVHAKLLTRFVLLLTPSNVELPTPILKCLKFVAQWRAEAYDSGIRRETLKNDTKLDKTLAFSGRRE